MKLSIGVVLLLSCLDYGLSWSDKHSSLVRNKRQASNPEGKRVVCYHTSWSAYRKQLKFTPDDIDPFLCTHVLYAYATLDKDIGVGPFDPKQDIQLEGYAKFIDLKKKNPKLKLILSVGGSKEGSTRFTKIASDPQLRRTFAKNSRDYLSQFGFDGIDLVWKYPGYSDGSSFGDKENYVQLLKALRREFRRGYSLSIALPNADGLIDIGYNLPEISKYVDFMTVLTYDYHTSTDPQVYHNAPLYPIPDDIVENLSIDNSIMNYIRRGVNPQKLNMAIALYGTIFVLEDAEQTDLGSPAEDEGAGTQERGAILYNHFCKRLVDENWTVKHVNKSAFGPYAYKDKSWIAYDDEDMIRTKARYAVEKNLGGLMFWSVDMDDFTNVCGPKKFPLIRAAGEELGIYSRTATIDLLNAPSPLPEEPSPEPEIPSPKPGIPSPEPEIPSPESEIPSPEPDIPSSQPEKPSPHAATPARPTAPTLVQPIPKLTKANPIPFQPAPTPPPDDNAIDRNSRANEGQQSGLSLNPDFPGANSIYSNRDIVIFHHVNVWTIFNNKKD